MNTKTKLLIAFFILLVALVAIVFVFVYFKYIKKSRTQKSFKNRIGNKLYRLANEEDHLLLNEFMYRVSDGELINIDHILFANKYIYIIKDVLLADAVSLSAKVVDNKWIVIKNTKQGPQKFLLNNQLKILGRNYQLLSALTRIDDSIFVPIVVINDDCKITDFVQNSTNIYLSSPKKLFKLIESIENSDVKDLNKDQITKAANDIARLNQNPNKR